MRNYNPHPDLLPLKGRGEYLLSPMGERIKVRGCVVNRRK
jgi:hypothetical protein